MALLRLAFAQLPSRGCVLSMRVGANTTAARVPRLTCLNVSVFPSRHVVHRAFSLTAPSLDGVESGTTLSSSAAGDLVETSSQAKWAADAATTLSDLPPQGDLATALSDLPPQGDLASLGLGGYSPIGLVQWFLDFLHVHAHLPWWAAIVATTVALRLVMLPIAGHLQANSVRLTNIHPETSKLMAKTKEHDQAGNTLLAAQAKAKLYALYQEHNCNPLKMMAMPILQVPIFISFFIAIRRMATLPVESMKSGGLLWFQDLTVADPYYVLPVLACASFLITMELGGEAGVSNPQAEKMKVLFRGMSLVLIPFTATFPAGVFMYWLPSSAMLMSQIVLLKIPSVRDKFGIPPLVKHPTPKDQGGFVDSIKQNYRSSVLIDQAKKRDTKAKKAYQKLKKDPFPKLYDKPPHKRHKRKAA